MRYNAITKKKTDSKPLLLRSLRRVYCLDSHFKVFTLFICYAWNTNETTLITTVAHRIIIINYINNKNITKYWSLIFLGEEGGDITIKSFYEAAERGTFYY